MSVLPAGKRSGTADPSTAHLPALVVLKMGAQSVYLAAMRSFDSAETGLGSEIVMRVPQTEQ